MSSLQLPYEVCLSSSCFTGEETETQTGSQLSQSHSWWVAEQEDNCKLELLTTWFGCFSYAHSVAQWDCLSLSKVRGHRTLKSMFLEHKTLISSFFPKQENRASWAPYEAEPLPKKLFLENHIYNEIPFSEVWNLKLRGEIPWYRIIISPPSSLTSVLPLSKPSPSSSSSLALIECLPCAGRRVPCLEIMCVQTLILQTRKLKLVNLGDLPRLHE